MDQTQSIESDCSSDDIPELESVASSEYTEESDDCAEPDDTDLLFVPKVLKSYLSSENLKPVENWLQSMKYSRAASDNFDALKAFACSPFLYGEHVDYPHWTMQWLPWFQQTNLLSNSRGNLDTLSWDEIRIVDIVDISFEWLWRKIQTESDLEYIVNLTDIWDIVHRQKGLESSLESVRDIKWFSELLKEIRGLPESLGLGDDLFGKHTRSVELCCLYACCYVGFKIKKTINCEDHTSLYEDFHRRHVSQKDNYRTIKSNLVVAEQRYHFFEDFDQKYREILNLWPFNVSVHESRSMCHLGMMQEQSLISDLYRILMIVKDHKMALLYIIKTFHDIGEKGREDMFKKKYLQHYPDEVARMEKSLEDGYDEPIFARSATGDEYDHYQKLKDLAAKGSDDILQENYETAQLYLKNCLKGMEATVGWHSSLQWESATSFVIGVRFGYAWTLYKMSKYDLALVEFERLQRASKICPIAASHYYSALCYIRMKRFCEATNTVNEGLHSFGTKYYRKPDQLVWPGTTKPIQECNQYYIKTKLLQMKAQLLPDTNTIATCPHPSCLEHNISRNIVREDLDFKGYTCLRCNEKCSIGFHPYCWRKFKVAHPEITGEKGFLSSPCITPDCPGIITYIAVYETATKPKFEVHLEDVKTTATTPVEDDSKVLNVKSKKKSHQLIIPSSQDVVKKSVSTSSSSSSIPAVQSAGAAAVEQQVPEPKVHVEENDENKEPKEEKVEEAQEQSSQVTEDSRKVEDSVSVINRLAEEEAIEKKSKTKKKKKKKTKTKKEESVLRPQQQQLSEGAVLPLVSGTKWKCYDIFQFGKRGGSMVEGGSPSEERKEIGVVDSDNSNRSYGKEAAVRTVSEDQLSSQESSESSSTPAGFSSSDHDWLLSYFVEVFKINGPMHPMDPVLVESQHILPEDNKKLIELYGGIGEFLMASSLFKTYEGGAKIGLKQDRAIIAETLENTHSSIGSGTASTPPTLPPTPPSSHPSNSAVGSEVARKKEKKQLASKWNPLHELKSTVSSSYVQGSLPVNNMSDGKGGTKKQSDTPPEAVDGGKGNQHSNGNGNGRTGKSDSVVDVPRHTRTPVGGSAGGLNKNHSETDVEPTKLSSKRDKTNSTIVSDRDDLEKMNKLKREKLLGSRKDLLSQGRGAIDVRKVKRGGALSPPTSSSSINEDLGSQSSDGGKRGSLKGNDQKVKPIGTGKYDQYKSEVAAMITSDNANSQLKAPPPPKSDFQETMMVSRGVNTDPIPQVESYRERYDDAIKERKSLEDKLEVSEDRMVRMQKQHGHELEMVERKIKNDCNKDMEKKIAMVEEKVKEEKEKAAREKKETHEQIKCFKAEIKTMTEKLSRVKKEMQRKEEEKNEELVPLQKECERLREEKVAYERMYHSLLEQHQYLLERAQDSEIMVINTKRENVMKPASVKLQELEKLCSCALQTIPGGEPELQQYMDQCKTMLDTFQNGLDEQVRKIQAGTELSKLEQLPPPTFPPITTSLRVKIQQIQRNMMLLQRKMLLQQQKQMSSPVVPIDATLASLPTATSQPHLVDPTQQLSVTSMPMAIPVPAMPPPPVPSNVPGTGNMPSSSTGSHVVPVATSVPSQPSPSTLLKKAEGKNTASFDYLVTLLSPLYPTYTRDDFKAVITQLRKSGSLSGQPMDVIVNKVKELILQKENLLLSHQQQQIQPHIQQQPASLAPAQFSLSQMPSLSQLSAATTPFPGSSMQPLALSQFPQMMNPLMDLTTSLSQFPTQSMVMPSGAFPPVNYMLHQPQQETIQAKQMHAPPKAPPPVFSEVEYNDDNSCVICYEDMAERNSLRLECGHRFHKTCIRSWLNEQNTCPTCRNHALLPEDFPHLQ